MIIKTTKPVEPIEQPKPEQIEVEFLGAYRNDPYKTLFFTKDSAIIINNWKDAASIVIESTVGGGYLLGNVNNLNLTRIEADEFLQEYEKALSQIEPVIFSMMPGGFLPNVSKGTFSLPEIPRTGENDFINNLENDMS